MTASRAPPAAILAPFSNKPRRWSRPSRKRLQRRRAFSALLPRFTSSLTMCCSISNELAALRAATSAGDASVATAAVLKVREVARQLTENLPPDQVDNCTQLFACIKEVVLLMKGTRPLARSALTFRRRTRRPRFGVRGSHAGRLPTHLAPRIAHRA
jgi:hypothetical protein